MWKAHNSWSPMCFSFKYCCSSIVRALLTSKHSLSFSLVEWWSFSVHYCKHIILSCKFNRTSPSCMILQSLHIISFKDLGVWGKYVFEYVMCEGVYSNFYLLARQVFFLIRIVSLYAFTLAEHSQKKINTCCTSIYWEIKVELVQLPFNLHRGTCVAVLSIPLNLIFKQFYFPAFILTEISALVHMKTGRQLRRYNSDTAWKLGMHSISNFCISAGGKQ